MYNALFYIIGSGGGFSQLLDLRPAKAKHKAKGKMIRIMNESAK